ncbi:Thiol:disulfide interchange protein DsbD precursor [Delftia tsuruhatensis]|nr:thioredoxin family protein [Delftia tsuruhatensis]CAB5698740.1 Thiol:disulfide interchange protein DsbD precursor [Delftia tsuruhatensis]CAC9676472.1 Thiol:disulfide interchange protein DsbD precursor [Delftia tsuruhatensis]
MAAGAFSTGAGAQIRLKSSSAPGATVETPRVRAELVAQAPEGVQPGQTLWLGLLLEHQPEWHTYWKNAGDSGLATELSWQLPAGLAAGAVQWPVPEALRVGPLVNYGYEGRVLLPVPVQVAADFKPPASGMLDLRLHASWLICRVECIPEEGDFQLQLPVQGSTAGQSQDFLQAWALKPQPLAPQAQARVLVAENAGAGVEGKTPAERVQLRLEGLPDALQGRTLDFYPESSDTFHHAAELGKDWQQHWDGAAWVAELPLSEMRGETPAMLPVVVALPPAERAAALEQGRSVAWRAEARVEGRWTAAAMASVSPALAAALAANQASAPATSATSLWMALLGGLVGGLILNLMPCVFPVLAIKVLGFARHGQDRRAQRLGGLAYTAGVVLSFLALGGLLLALRAAGEQLGWGFQLQSPAIVALLAALFTLLGLNLAGMFEFGSMLPGSWAAAHARHPVADAFLSGVLAVAIASPCTAPFMGASLGFAIDMPAPQALTVFAALGLGMALPYLLASFVPAVVRWLPRPGAWMDTFRRAMAFPMFATVVWLVWVLGHQSGMDAAAALLALLLAFSALVWTLTLQGRTRAVLATLVVALSGALLATALPLITTPARAEGSPAQAASGERWQPWSATRVAELQAQGKPVFVDYTAAWCVTCQVNKRTTLSHEEVLAAFDRHGVALLRADWTRRDPAITAALQQLGRSGVPVYVLHAPGKPPVVLSELLSRGEVLQALDTL